MKARNEINLVPLDRQPFTDVQQKIFSEKFRRIHGKALEMETFSVKLKA